MAETHTARLDRLPLRTSTLKASLRRESTPVDRPEVIASAIFDDAVIGAGLTNQHIGAALDVNESLVGRWRNPNAREFPSLLQLQKLGPDFLRALNSASCRHNGLGRRALLSLLDAAGDLANSGGGVMRLRLDEPDVRALADRILEMPLADRLRLAADLLEDGHDAVADTIILSIKTDLTLARLCALWASGRVQ